MSRTHDLIGRAVLASAVFGSWLWHFGLMGAEYSADTAVANAMALRPFAPTSLYIWSQNRQGMAIPLLARALHLALGVPVHPTLQLLFYSVAALGLFFAMGLLKSWPLRLALATFLAWPSQVMAESLCNHYLVPAAFLLTVAQVYAFGAAVREPSPLRIAWSAMLAGFLFWIAENCVVLFPAELWIVGCAIWRARGRTSLASIAAALAGVALPAAIIAVGKTAVKSAGVWSLISPSQAASVAVSLSPQLRELAPALGGFGMYVLLVVIFAWAAADLWSLRKSDLRLIPPFALLGTAPLLGLIGTSFSRHFELNLRLARYLSWPAVIAILGGCLALDRLLADIRRPALARVGAWAAGAALGVGCWLGRFPGNGPEDEAHWRHKLQFALDQGCESVIGNHWDVYPLMDLSEGRILVTPVGPAPRIVNPSLAFDAIRQTEVCRIRTQRQDPGPCEPHETYYGSGLRLLGEVGQNVDGEEIHLCRFAPEPFSGYCARAADLPRVGGPSEMTLVPQAEGATSPVLEQRGGIRFGPYIGAQAGQYRYLTRLSGAGPGAAVRLDVFSAALGGVITQRSLAAEELPPPGTWRIFSLPFTLSQGVGDLELRIVSGPGSAPLREDWIALFKSDAGPAEGVDLRDPPCGALR